MTRVFGMVSTASSRDYTPVALKTFFLHTPLRESDRFLLIDNDGSLDGTALCAEFPRIEFQVNQRPRSFAENANAVLAEARKTRAAFFFLNNDIAFTPGWINPVETDFASISLPACNTDFLLQGPSFSAKWTMSLPDYVGHEQAVEELAIAQSRKGPGLQRVLCVPFFCVRIHPEVYETLGDFDTRFGIGGGEDSDYAVRAALQGYSVMVACSAWVLHFVGRSTWNGAEKKEQTELRDKAYREAFRKKWGDPLTRLFILRDATVFERHPELKPLHDEGSFRRLVARLCPSRHLESLLWHPGLSSDGYALEMPQAASLDPLALYEAIEYATDRRHVARWTFGPGEKVCLKRLSGEGQLGERLPTALDPLVKNVRSTHFDQVGSLPLSLCMIVKNEAQKLGSCLRSVRDLVREIVIVDTGSTDGTRELATVYGARLISGSWEEDYSKIRNLGLEAATQPWILVLDADEIMLDCDKAALRELLKSHQNTDTVFSFQQNTSPDGGRTCLLSDTIRLFPRRPELRYEWPLHEQLASSLGRAGITVQKTSIRILHPSSLDTEAYLDKQRRYLSLLQAQIERAGAGLDSAWYHSGSAQLELGDIDAALTSFETCERVSQDGNEFKAASKVSRVLCLTKLGRHEEALRQMTGEPGPQWHPKLLSLRAECESALGRIQQALPFYEQVIASQPGAYLPPCNVIAEKVNALICLGGYWRDQGKPALGVALLKKALECRQTGADFRPEMLQALQRALGGVRPGK